MWSARLCAAVLVCNGLFVCAGIQAADSADCTGAVLDENGVPVVAALVVLEDASGRAYRTATDATGRFSFHDLSPGDYKAEVRKEGFFVLAGQPITLHAGANELSLILNHEQEVREKVQVTAPANQIDRDSCAEDCEQRDRAQRAIDARR